MKNSYPEPDEEILDFCEVLSWNIWFFSTYMMKVETLEKCVKEKVGVLHSPKPQR